MTELLTQQFQFSRSLVCLYNYAFSLGLEIQGGELWRTPEQAAWYAKQGKGIVNSGHRNRLAIDLMFWRDGKTAPREDYQLVGSYWKSLSTKRFKHCWGGDFKSTDDIYHFSFEFNGVR